jgi:putative oxidoreductase
LWRIDTRWRCFVFAQSGEIDAVAYGILFLRVVVGSTLAAHGSQKLFGWFGGPGPQGTAGFFGKLGFRPPLAMAIVAGLSEAAGIAFALGFLTPFAALAMASVMVVAIASVHWQKGYWLANGGYEYNLVLWTVAVAVAAMGPGRFSIDNALGWAGNLSGLWWGAGVAVASIVSGLLVVSTRQIPPEDDATDAPLARDAEAETSAVA